MAGVNGRVGELLYVGVERAPSCPLFGRQVNDLIGTTILSIVLSIFFVIRAFHRGSNRGMLGRKSSSRALDSTPANIESASIRHASLAFGPPMLFCEFQDKYSSFQFMRIFWGGMVGCLAFFLYLFVFLERSSETGEDDRVPKKVD